MIYLKTYEAFDIDNFKTFIDKYRKSGGYVSKSDIKRLDTSIKYENFKIIEESVDRCLEFFKNNDFELLEDILLDLYDECPYLDREKTRKFFSLKCNSRNYGGWYSGTEFDIIATNVVNYDQPDARYELKDSIELIDNIISHADNKLRDEIAKERESISKGSDQSGRPGKESYSVIKLRSLLKVESPFTKMIITPNILINFTANNQDDYYDYDYTDRHNMQNENNEKINKIKTLLEPAIGRYLNAIGYFGLKTYVKCDYAWSSFLSPNFKIEISKQSGLF